MPYSNLQNLIRNLKNGKATFIRNFITGVVDFKNEGLRIMISNNLPNNLHKYYIYILYPYIRRLTENPLL